MKSIFVLGSINMDLVINSPYMPKAGETVTGSGFMTNPGGKGANQAAACGKMGCCVYMAGCVGDDVFGKNLIDNLKSYNVDCGYIRTVKNTPSGIAVIVVAENDNRIILSRGANACVNQGDVDRMLEKASAGDIFMAQLEIPIETVVYGIKKAKEKGLITILNPAPANKACAPALGYADIFMPNESELELLGGSPDIDVSAKNLFKMGVKTLIVTLGSKGSVIINADKKEYVKSFKVKAVDTTAAGDTFCGTVAAGLSKGEGIISAMKTASAASAICVTKKGAQVSIPAYAEVQEFIKNYKF